MSAEPVAELTTEKKRIDFLDVARGIAMICIILGHVGNGQLNRVVFTFHIPIFYFITGYFINKDDNTLKFILRKARTLLVPYAATCAVVVIWALIRGYFINHNILEPREWLIASLYGAGDTYTHPFNVRGIGAIWFLWATFWGSCFLKISLHFKPQLRVLFITALFLFGYITPLKLFWFPLSIQAGACATAFMYLGYLLKQPLNRFKDIPIPVRIFGLLISLYIWIKFISEFQSFWLVHSDMGRGLIDVIGSVCGCICLLFVSWLIAKYTRFVSGLFKFIGKNSLLFLCIHLVELNMFPWVDYFLKLTTDYNLLLTLILSGKIIGDTLILFLLSKVKPLMWLMGYKVKHS